MTGKGYEIKGLHVICECDNWVPAVEMCTYMEGLRRVRELYNEINLVTTRMPKESEWDELIEMCEHWADNLQKHADTYKSLVRKHKKELKSLRRNK